PLKEVVVAPVLATERAFKRLTDLTRRLSTHRYRVMTAEVLPEKLCCFGGRSVSYLNGHEPIADLSSLVKQLSDDVYALHFADPSAGLSPDHRHGFGKLALAFVMFSNCPDNSLPLIWKRTKTWPHPLFQRVSRIL